MLQLIQKAIQAEWPIRLLSPFFGKLNPFTADFRANPYPQYARLQRGAPIYRSPALGSWVLSRHSDVVALLSNPIFSVDRQQSNVFRRLNIFGALTPDLAEAVLRSLLMLDPPDHTRLRKLVVKAFTPRRVELLRGRIEQIVDDLLERVAGQEEVDVISALAYPLPVIVIAEMLGVPSADRDRFKQWSDRLAALLDPFQAEGGLKPIEQAFLEIRAYLHEVFAARRITPGDDLISALVQAEEEGSKLDEAELLALVMLLLGAGNETTTNLIGNAIVVLARHPEQYQRWRAEPGLARSAIEEMLRFDSPVQVTDRVALSDCEIHGRRIRKGQMVAALLGAANRDPEIFVDPDRLDLGRDPNPHVSFGFGTHFCLGAQLARLEGQIALNAFLARYPSIELCSGSLDWKRSLVLRGPTKLRVKVARPR